MKRLPSSCAIVVTLGALSSWSATALGQDLDEWSLQKFRPAIHSVGGFTTEGARVSHGLTINAHLMANVAGDMLQLANDEQAVDFFGSADLVASIGVIDHLSFGLDVPFHFGTGTFLDGDDLSPFTVGDLRLSLKATAIKPYRIGGGIGLAVDLLVPSGSKGGYGREDGVVVVPKVVLDAMTEHVHLMTNIWFFARSGTFEPDQRVLDFPESLELGTEFGASSALAVFLGSTDFRMIVEGRFESAIERFFDKEMTRLELTWGMHWRIDSGFALGGGASFGVLDGYGDPSWRGFLTVGYQPANLIPVPGKAGDADRDGVRDDVDQCPADPEDLDAFEDADGCPELDNDQDGVPDTEDKCPNKAEDLDGDRDNDGCPDGDGDKDGIPDDLDRCPTQPEDVDGFEDEDGCPDPDNDKDGMPDAIDRCPSDPEDKDGNKDDDGCPETDNDSDGIPDLQDKCPDRAEDIDGCQDEDGCPEEGRVCVSKEKITISEKIFFKTGKADILPKSYGLLAELAKVINENPQIELIEIQGHTDDQGPDDFNLKLSDARANAVLAHLVTIGSVDARRLRARGYGEDVPIGDNRSAAGRELNRRVEFMILKQKTE